MKPFKPIADWDTPELRDWMIQRREQMIERELARRKALKAAQMRRYRAKLKARKAKK